MRLNDLSTGEKLAALGGVLAAVAAFLPWFTVDSLMRSASVSGLSHGDGLLTLVCGLGGVGIVLFRERGRLETLGLGVAGAVTSLVGYYTLSQVSEFGGLAGDASASYGVYLTLVAGVLLLGGTALVYRTPADAPRGRASRG